MSVFVLSGYFGNSINAWRDGLVKRRRQLEVRQKTLDMTEHPCAVDQRALSKINDAMIRTIDREYKRALERAFEEDRASPDPEPGR